MDICAEAGWLDTALAVMQLVQGLLQVCPFSNRFPKPTCDLKPSFQVPLIETISSFTTIILTRPDLYKASLPPRISWNSQEDEP